jgi:hypothetical protein
MDLFSPPSSRTSTGRAWGRDQKWGGKRPQTEGKKEKRKRKEKEVPGFHLVDSVEADDVSVLFD